MKRLFLLLTTVLLTSQMWANYTVKATVSGTGGSILLQYSSSNTPSYWSTASGNEKSTATPWHIKITVTPDANYQLATLTANTTDITSKVSNNVYSTYASNDGKVSSNITYTATFESTGGGGGSGSGSGSGPTAVDLGLPSGTQWADMNLGASSETDAGSFYSFGETSTKSNFAENQYAFNWNTSSNYETMDGEQMLKDSYDAACTLGEGYHTPTKAEFQELKDNCNVTSVTGGWRFTSKKNGNSIVIPKSGYKTGSGNATTSSEAYLYTRTIQTNSLYIYNSYIYYLNVSNSGAIIMGENGQGKPSNGMTIRPVYVPANTTITATFNCNNGTASIPRTCNKYTQPSIPSTPTKNPTTTTTYTFNGWNPAVGKISVPTTYNATYTESTRYYTVNFTSSTATLSKSSGSYTYDGAITDVTVTPNAGYVFDHWENAGGTPVNLNSITKTDNMTLTAVCVPQFDNSNGNGNWNEAGNWYNDILPTAGDDVCLTTEVQVAVGTQQANNLTVNNTLTIENGAILVVNGNLTIAENKQVVVEPTGVLKVNGTISGTGILLQSSAAGNAQLILPTSGTVQPYATVQLYTRAKHDGSYVWQHFGVPTTGTDASWTRSEVVSTWVYNWDAQTGWANAEYTTASALLSTPFKGHNLTNTSATGGVIYTFIGQMVGNAVSPLAFPQKGWNFLANSYNVNVSLASILSAMPDDVEASVYTYDGGTMHQATLGEIEAGEATISTLKPMQAFFLHAMGEGVATQNVSYASVLVDPTAVSNAPARRAGTAIDYTGRVFITATSKSGVADQVKLRESAEWNNNDWNTMDGTKLITNGHGIYAMNNGKLASFATNQLVGTVLGFTAGSDSEYTLTFSNLIGETYVLKDLQTGAVVEMKESESYKFNAEPTSVNEARFVITERLNVTTGTNAVQVGQQVVKVVENGRVILLKDGVRRTVLGTKMD